MTADDTARSHTALQSWVRALESTARLTAAPHRTLGQLVSARARAQPQAPALLGEEHQLDYDALARRSHRYARWGLAQALAPGAVVALVMENEPEYLAVWLGLTRVGVVVALINVQLRGAALAHALRLAAPQHVIVGASLRNELAAELPRALAEAGSPAPVWCGGPAAQADRDLEAQLQALPDSELSEQEHALPRLSDRALLIYTSGTTGLPKAAPVSHLRVLQWSAWFAGMTGCSAEDRVYDCLPMYHSVGGIVAPGAALVSGAAVIVRRRFSARRFWSDIQASGATIFQYIGELCRILLHESAPAAGPVAHRLRLACGNGLAAEVWEPFRTRFAIPRILEFYAATEANFSLYNCEGRPGALGRVPPFFAHRYPLALVRFDGASSAPLRDAQGRCQRCAVGEAGEAISRIRGKGGEPGLRFEGYTDDAATGAKVLHDVFEEGDAWYRSGDLMRCDAEGFYYFVDRIGDTFRWRGENVATTEVARALCGAPGVQEALVYGVAVPGNDGRAGMAALQVGPEFDLAALDAHLRDSLPRYARPVFLRLLTRVERTGTFKPVKHELAAAGFDPQHIADPLFVHAAEPQSYVPLDAAAYRHLLSGAWRF